MSVSNLDALKDTKNGYKTGLNNTPRVTITVAVVVTKFFMMECVYAFVVDFETKLRVLTLLAEEEEEEEEEEENGTSTV